MLCAKENLFAQKKRTPKPADKEEIVITEHAATPRSIFKLNDTVQYSIDLKSTYNTPQEGRISYAITDLKNNLIAKQSMPVSLPANGFKQVQINMPGQKAGFYRVNFMLNVTDDDDTVRRVFGVDTSAIHSEYKRPVDFDDFWLNAKSELAKVAPEFKMTEQTAMESGNDQIYLIEMKSLGNITVRGWLTLPKDRKPGEKFPVTLGLPGYGSEMKPFRGTTAIAYLGLNVRGLGNSRDVIHPLRDDFIDYGIESKDTYIFRGVMMDCIRAVDFLCSRPEIDTQSIYTTGGSMGGYLALALASLDKRIALCSADNPGYPDLRYIDKTWDVFPFNTMRNYARKKGLNYANSLDVWDYFDLKNFVSNITCPAVVGIGLLDNFIPPTAELAMYNNIKSTKKLIIFPNIAHDVGPEMGDYVGKWVFDTFHIYDKWLAYNQPVTAVKSVATPVVKPDEDAAKGETVSIAEHPLNKNAIFSSSGVVSYNLDVKSTYNSQEDGKVGYIVTTPEGKLLSQDFVSVTLAPKQSKTVLLNIPAQNSGFYKVSFTVNLSDYDDTIRRVFGVDTNRIKESKPKPGDFDAFWANAKKELALIAPKYKVTEKPELEHGDKIYLIEMQSLGNITIRGYMSLPNDLKPGEKLPVSLYLPGYGAQAQPMPGVPGMAILSLSVRGQELSNDVINPGREDYISYKIEDKNKYILRGAVMDCERLVDFVTSRPELDSTAIYAAGASMGGYFSIALSSLDRRITICSANNPTFSDFRTLAKSADEFPMGSIRKYAKAQSLPMDALLNNLDYFDLKNFAPNVRCSTVIGIGLLDNIAPPTTELTMYNNITAPKKLFVFPDKPHDVGPEIGNFVGGWVYEKLHVYDKYSAFHKSNAATADKQKVDEPETITLTEHSATKDATFKLTDVASYTVDLKNNFNTDQNGKVSYIITTTDGKFLNSDSIAVSLKPQSSKQVLFEFPSHKSGFYRVSFIVNVSDYDDTVKRVFGVDINNIRSNHTKPADFESFWSNTKKELAKVAPNYKVVEKKELESGNDLIYAIEMQSLDNVTIRGWMTLPKDRRSKARIPVYVALPGYGAAMQPFHNVTDFAMVTIDVRGLGASRDVIDPSRDDYIGYNIDDKNKYILRGSIMDCERLIDFVCSRPELDPHEILVTGGSMGGYFAMVLASIDKRVSLCAADNPTFSDFRSLVGSNQFPMALVEKAAKDNLLDMNKVLSNLDYFDLKNFVKNIDCKIIVAIGLLDLFAPPASEMVMYNEISSDKKIFIYPNLGHEVDPELGNYKARWFYDNLGML